MQRAIIFIAMLFILCLPMSCAITRQEARSALVVSAKGVLWANEICARVGKILADTHPKDAVDGLTMCSHVSKTAFIALENADDILDREGVAASLCAVKTAVEAIGSMVTFARSHGTAVPSKIVDVVGYAHGIGALCR